MSERDFPTLLVIMGDETLHAVIPEADRTVCGKAWKEDNLPVPKEEMRRPWKRICGHCKRIEAD